MSLYDGFSDFPCKIKLFCKQGMTKQVPEDTTMRPKSCRDWNKDCEIKIVKERLWNKDCERKIVKDCERDIEKERL